ncbi:hypothetical protein KFE25_002396 [Diacronema lutheri]|uniref:ANK_REP_REGION domain-containing protein n=1 Tax=Diacronema lutheri TaxID=2081491 RepID=A0A8J5XHP1_DIALT|nr:hypothetical protein KFE25_002396 [Diacronema lutheri]
MLLAATSCADVRVCAQLLLAGADVNIVADGGLTPCHVACLAPFSEALFDVLLDAGADINALAQSVGTPLHTAVRAGASAEHIEKLCAQPQILLERRQADGATALHVAIAIAEASAVQARALGGGMFGASRGRGSSASPSVRGARARTSPAKQRAERMPAGNGERGRAATRSQRRQRGAPATGTDGPCAALPAAMRARMAAVAHEAALGAAESASVLLVRGADCSAVDEHGHAPPAWLHKLRAEAEVRSQAILLQYADDARAASGNASAGSGGESARLAPFRIARAASAGARAARGAAAPPMAGSALVLRVARALAPELLEMAACNGPAAQRATLAKQREAEADARLRAARLTSRRSAPARPVSAGAAVPPAAAALARGARARALPSPGALPPPPSSAPARVIEAAPPAPLPFACEAALRTWPAGAAAVEARVGVGAAPRGGGPGEQPQVLVVTSARARATSGGKAAPRAPARAGPRRSGHSSL